MIIVSVRAGTGEDLRRAELPDGSLFSFRLGCLSDGLASCLERFDELAGSGGLELDEAEAAEMAFARACLAAEKAGLRLVARAEQNACGLNLKLKKRGHERLCAAAAVARLCADGLVDDRRYARLWLASRIAGRASSPRELLGSLRSRGIGRDDAAAAFDEVLDADAECLLLERFLVRHRRRYGDPASLPAEGLRTLRYRLRGEGFSAGAVERVFGGG